jgi:hypothetical protein
MTSVSRTFTISVVAAPVTGLPTYAQGMTDYQVRNLSTVSNGMTTMYAVTPTEWRGTGGDNNLSTVINAWSGGGGDATGRRLFVHGGGHADSANNGLYVFDFNGTTQATGWTLATNSLSAYANRVSTTVDANGYPASIHTYDQVRYDPINNRFYRLSGCPYPGGNTTSTSTYYDFANNRWKPTVLSSSAGTIGGSAFISPDGAKAVLVSCSTSAWFINTSTGTTSAVTIGGSWMGNNVEEGACLTMDDTRSTFAADGICKYVGFGGRGAWVLTINWTAQTVTAGARPTLTGTGASYLNTAYSSQGPAVLFDAKYDCFWAFAMRSQVESANPSVIVKVDASTFVATSYPLNGNTLSSQSGNRGSYARYVWMPDWRIIGTVQSSTQPASIIKLPD